MLSVQALELVPAALPHHTGPAVPADGLGYLQAPESTSLQQVMPSLR